MIATQAKPSTDYAQGGVVRKTYHIRNVKKAFAFRARINKHKKPVPVEYWNGNRLIFTRFLRRAPRGTTASFQRCSWGRQKWNSAMLFKVQTKNLIAPSRAPCWVVAWTVEGKPESIVRPVRKLAEKYAASIGCAKVKHISECRWHPYYPKRKAIK